MAFSELETARVRKIVGGFVEARRPPVHIRPELDIGYRIVGQSVEIFETRPAWRGKPGETVEKAVAKATWVRTDAQWRVFWMRSDLKWHGYAPVPAVVTVEEFVDLVNEDPWACFWG
ncbi:MAG: DUF3024 domain-containing protein [Xanthomonadales bacterium]|nr:DUF3024 domain-containing protein [Xanthomonadales bacterium]